MPGRPHAAVMSQYQFLPGNIPVKKGTVVTWRNDDDIEHLVVIPALGTNSDTMYNGATFSVKFDAPGDYDIRCGIHAGMRAKVSVQP